MRHAYVLLVIAACRSTSSEVALGPELGAEIGTAHPFVLRDIAKNGHWLIACQARRDTDDKPGVAIRREDGPWAGDKLVPYLVRGSGPGNAIETFMDASDDDRWIVVVRDRALHLIDDHDGSERVLADADLRAANGSYDRKTAGFTSDSAYVVYERGRDKQTSVVVHTLATHEERELPIDDDVWRIETAGGPTSPWLEITRMAPQPSRSTRPAWPWLVDHRSAGRPCETTDVDENDNSVLHTYWLRPSTGEWEFTQPAIPAKIVQPRIGDAIVLGASGSKRLMADGFDEAGSYHVFWFIDTRTGMITLLHGLVGRYSAGNERFVAIGATLIDVEQGRIVGELPRAPLAVDNAGHALVPAIEEAIPAAAVGPARWMSAMPAQLAHTH